jgi:hypothetical protein
MRQMVFVPVSRTAARSLRDSAAPALELTGYAATPSLLRAHDYDQSTLEDAEYAALGYAGAAAAIDAAWSEPLRLVLAAELSSDELTVDGDSPHGVVHVPELRWRDVRALFSDEEASAATVAAARDAAAGRPLVEALAVPELETAVDEADLLWFSPDELDRLP